MFEGFQARRIAANGTEINLVMAGSGPPLLLLHGYPQTHAIWHRIAPALARDHDVAGLDVAVDQVVVVGGGQPLGDLPADSQRFEHVERAGAVELLLQRLAGDELHHQVRQRLFAGLVHLHHVLVPHLG